MERPSSNLLACWRDNPSVAVLTGAGISAASGLPTFRGAGGWWKKYRAEDLATPEAFQKDPRRVWEWYNHRRDLVRRHAPNPGHFALARFEPLCKTFALITQNVDGYHQRAGSANVSELHGNIMKSRCSACSRVCEAGAEDWKDGLPYCSCGALYRPGVVWFGETLPAATLQDAFIAAENCQIFFAIGTSSVVYPAAALSQMALEHGAYVVEINDEATPLTPHASEFLKGRAGEILPALVKFFQSGDKMKPLSTRPRSAFWQIAILAATILSLQGCGAYFNTFYNTKKLYKEALEEQKRRGADNKPTSMEIQKYDKAIEKGSKLLQLHPKSRYVDD
ncbi:MAG: NAD-dependent protein deacylase, partial [bacterium]